MGDKQCKQMERFLENDYFLQSDDTSEQISKVKIDNTQGYEPGQIKKEELSGDLSKFPPVTQAIKLLISIESTD